MMEKLKSRIRKVIPKNLYLSLWKCKSRWKYRTLVDYYSGHPKECARVKSELAFIERRGFPPPFDMAYEFAFKYHPDEIEVSFDDDKGLYYVMHKGKRLYFYQNSEQEVRQMYCGLIVEQDAESPHRYLDDEMESIAGGCFVDVGAAEGMISLELIESVERAIIIEVEKKWIPALKATFEPWCDKVSIANKKAGSIDDDETVKVDSLVRDWENTSGALGEGKDILIKIDVEGSEGEVLSGARDLIERGCSMLICTYHDAGDEEKFQSFFTKRGYDVSFSKGYMLRINYDGRPPYFRRGVMHAFKEAIV
jgi:hypothetical protein